MSGTLFESIMWNTFYKGLNHIKEQRAEKCCSLLVCFSASNMKKKILFFHIINSKQPQKKIQSLFQALKLWLLLTELITRHKNQTIHIIARAQRDLGGISSVGSCRLEHGLNHMLLCNVFLLNHVWNQNLEEKFRVTGWEKRFTWLMFGIISKFES